MLGKNRTQRNEEIRLVTEAEPSTTSVSHSTQGAQNIVDELKALIEVTIEKPLFTIFAHLDPLPN